MAIIEPVKNDIQHPQRKKKYSSLLRLWHWANVIIISGSLLTVLLNSTLLNRNYNAGLPNKPLHTAKLDITPVQSKFVVHALSERIWAVHTYFGFGLAALVLFRLILEFFQQADQRFLPKFKSAYAQYKVLKKKGKLANHELAVKLIYLMFYLLIITMAVTGLTMAFSHYLGVSNSMRHKIQEVHGFGMYLILAFIAVHLAGVFLAERKDSTGIVSDMINGGKE